MKVLTEAQIEALNSLEQPKPHFAMTGFNIMPLKIEEPIFFNHPTKGKSRIISSNGLNIKGESTFGLEYGQDYKFYESGTIEQLSNPNYNQEQYNKYWGIETTA